MIEWVVSFCDLTGHMVEPWVNNGYRGLLVDPQHPKGVTRNGAITRLGHVVDDTHTWSMLRAIIQKDRVAFVSAFPPCTDLAVSGARWFEHKGRKDWAFQFKAMQIVWQCHSIAELLGAPYMIENPVSVISSIWRKPDHTFSPSDFTGHEPDDNYNKQTMLWTSGGFIMPTPRRDLSLGPPDDRIHRAPPNADRANFRSATPRGFARAVYEANGEL